MDGMGFDQVAFSAASQDKRPYRMPLSLRLTDLGGLLHNSLMRPTALLRYPPQTLRAHRRKFYGQCD